MGSSREIDDLAVRSSRLAHAGVWDATALKVNTRLTELAPRAVGAWWRVGICSLEAEDLGGARLAFVRVIELKPSSGDARAAQAHLERIDASAAVARCSSTTAALREARVCRSRGELAAALLWNQRGVELARTTVDETNALAEWAAALRGERDYKKALNLLRRSIALEPDRSRNRVTYVVFIGALADAGDLAEAKVQADKLLRLFPRDPYVLNAAGRAFMALWSKTREPSLRDSADRCFALAGR